MCLGSIPPVNVPFFKRRFIRSLLALLLCALIVPAHNVLAEDTTITEHDDGSITVEDDSGNVVHEDAKGNLHVEDEDGNYVKMDKHGNVREVEDTDGNVVSLDKKGNVKSADIIDEDGQRVIIK